MQVRLNTNESPYPPPQEWRDSLADAMGDVVWERYPDRSATVLRRAIGEVHGVGPEQIFAANGSNEVLQTLLLTFAGAGRTVATFEPTYQLHGHLARLSGARVAEGERTADFELDLGEVDRVLGEARPAVTFLCSPNNPTGLEERVEHLDHVLGRAPGLVVVDEAYGQFASWSAIPLVAEDVPMVVTRTFSKTWSMAAARLGYLVGPAWLVAELDKVVLPYHLDSFKQLAGRLALDHVAAMEERVALIVAERQRLVAGLAGLPVDVWPSGANFVLFRPRAGGDRGSTPFGRRVWSRLVERSVLVRDCSSWPRLDGCLRVTVGAAADNDRFLAELAGVLAAEEPA